ncbi:hypothetical protein EASAB2608_05415 [Streptomyces sp. EAS-AB2608]|uniref:Uncharacterized protein n=1 Tax=Streptomyces bangladeshensis TaxID=295352 RepID=A0ABN3BJ08_9ACTN|nr:hypothetical protein EASAB2608_05415 [Streptomyces sp. EAS-AB2608]
MPPACGKQTIRVRGEATGRKVRSHGVRRAEERDMAGTLGARLIDGVSVPQPDGVIRRTDRDTSLRSARDNKTKAVRPTF